jgi:hypothetical protein
MTTPPSGMALREEEECDDDDDNKLATGLATVVWVVDKRVEGGAKALENDGTRAAKRGM